MQWLYLCSFKIVLLNHCKSDEIDQVGKVRLLTFINGQSFHDVFVLVLTSHCKLGERQNIVKYSVLTCSPIKGLVISWKKNQNWWAAFYMVISRKIKPVSEFSLIFSTNYNKKCMWQQTFWLVSEAVFSWNHVDCWAT